MIRRMEGWVDLAVCYIPRWISHLIAARPEVEPTTSRSQVRHICSYGTEPLADTLCTSSNKQCLQRGSWSKAPSEAQGRSPWSVETDLKTETKLTFSFLHGHNSPRQKSPPPGWNSTFLPGQDPSCGRSAYLQGDLLFRKNFVYGDFVQTSSVRGLFVTHCYRSSTAYYALFPGKSKLLFSW